jgi:uncharacterized protein YcnI
VLAGASAEAHVRITPQESKAGATETYNVRVPTEGEVATSSVELEVPVGVNIVSAEATAPGTYELKRESGRVVTVTWTLTIKPGDIARFSFVAQNPQGGETIVWKVRQRYADGTSSDWIGPAGTRSPAPVTKLVSAAP